MSTEDRKEEDRLLGLAWSANKQSFDSAIESMCVNGKTHITHARKFKNLIIRTMQAAEECRSPRAALAGLSDGEASALLIAANAGCCVYTDLAIKNERESP